MSENFSEIIKNTWAEGLSPSYQPMDQKKSELFVMASMAEALPGSTDRVGLEKDLDQQFFIKVLNARIEGMKLPIKFTPEGKLAILALSEVVGAAVVILIDCLNAFEGKEVTAGMLADLYPVGFYDEKTFHRYVEDYLKPRKCKWADVYISK